MYFSFYKLFPVLQIDFGICGRLLRLLVAQLSAADIPAFDLIEF